VVFILHENVDVHIDNTCGCLTHAAVHHTILKDIIIISSLWPRFNVLVMEINKLYSYVVQMKL